MKLQFYNFTTVGKILLMIVCIAIPLAIGGLSSYLTKDMMFHFQSVAKPPLAPPGFLFPIVWTILYILMGISFYFILTFDVIKNGNLASIRNWCIILFIIQLIMNFFWSILFFGYKLYFTSFIWLLILLTIVIILAIFTFRINKYASLSLMPYILWVTFASYLNIGIALLN